MRTCKQKALEWGISERTVNDLCKKGRIPGAVKNGGRWQIPDEAIKPEDGRISSGRYVRARGQEKLRSLPIGISDYARAQSEYYYVDKTLLIKEFLDKKPMVSYRFHAVIFFQERSRITGICLMDFLQASCELHRRAFSAD